MSIVKLINPSEKPVSKSPSHSVIFICGQSKPRFQLLWKKRMCESILFGTRFAHSIKWLRNRPFARNISKSFAIIILALGCALCFNSVHECKTWKNQRKGSAGFKYFKAISAILENLHNAGCARDRAGNRKLHMDQYISLVLLYMFKRMWLPWSSNTAGPSKSFFAFLSTYWVVVIYWAIVRMASNCKPIQRSLPACWFRYGRVGNQRYVLMRCSAGTLPAWLTNKNYWLISGVCKNMIKPPKADP